MDPQAEPPVNSRPASAEARADAAVVAAVDAVVAAAKAPDYLLTADEWAHLSKRDQRLLRGIFERVAKRGTLSTNPFVQVEQERTLGERVADRIAVFGGSWTFILLFLAFLAFWAILNTWILSTQKAFDAYPYIFLNLMLSMLAALQAPVIMMSQSRQAKRDRAEAENDYEVNLKAEIEIRELHDKLDELRHGQWVQLVAQQEEQIKLLASLCGPTSGKPEQSNGTQSEVEKATASLETSTD